jgi:hypothetical protein
MENVALAMDVAEKNLNIPVSDTYSKDLLLEFNLTCRNSLIQKIWLISQSPMNVLL